MQHTPPHTVPVSPATCPLCGCRMDGFVQFALYPGAKDRSYEHCMSKDCDLEGVTLASGDHANLTKEQIKAYSRAKALRLRSDTQDLESA